MTKRISMDTHNKPCAAPGYTSYRARGRYGWIMIGAKDTADALREAKRSTTGNIRDLEIWDATQLRYVPVTP